jgi:glycosyltransferase involved in cell wall biosynthesis
LPARREGRQQLDGNGMQKEANSQKAVFSVCVAMLGARMHYAVPIILEHAGLLGRFYTDIYIGNKPWIRHFLKILPRKHWPITMQRLYGRTTDNIPKEKVVSFDFLGLWYLWKRYFDSSPKRLSSIYARVNKVFCENVVQRGLSGAMAVYGFNGASLEIFRFAKQNGISCILEQTLAPRRIEKKLLNEEIIHWPEWQPGITFEDEVNSDPLVERETGEWELADRILCASDFVADGLQNLGVKSSKCKIVPYGINIEYFQPMSRHKSNNGLNVLFVGEVGLRKGVPYLLEALRLINAPRRILVRLAGPVVLNQKRLAEYSRWCEVLGTVPRSRILEMYAWADIFVFPSICEGSATVTYEALACGLPVITTDNAGSVVRDEVEGYIIPVRDVNALREKLIFLLENETSRRRMAVAARARALEFSWDAYSKRLLEAFGC